MFLCPIPMSRSTSHPGGLLGVVLLTGWMAGCATSPFSVESPGAPAESGDPGQLFASEDELRQSGLQPLSGLQVRRLLGKPVRYTWVTPGGASGRAIISTNDNIRIIWDTGAANGRLRFTRTGYCNRIHDQRNQPETCYRAYPTGPGELSVFKEDGTPTGRITLQAP